MRRVWLMAAGAAAVFDVSTPTSLHSALRENPAPTGAVTAVSLQRVSGRAELAIAVSGSVNVEDFALASPQRIVIDIKGATLKMSALTYDRIVRGGITNIRIAQTNANDVRVVLDVDRNRDYKVVRGEGDVRVSFDSADEFEPWIAGIRIPPPSARMQASEVQTPVTQARTITPPVTPPAGFLPPKTGVATSDFVAIPESTKPLLQQVGGRITVSFYDTELRDVLAVFSERSGRSIVTSVPSMKITAEIINQPWQVALSAILDAYGLAATDDPVSRIIVVGTRAALQLQVASEPLETRRVMLNYAKADVLALTITSLLSADCGPSLPSIGLSGGAATGAAGAAVAAGAAAPPVVDGGVSAAAAASGAGGSAVAGNGGQPPAPAQQAAQQQRPPAGGCAPRGRVVSEPSTNSLIITEARTRIDSLLAYVASFDFMPAQVNIKAQVISINRTNTERLGISYDLGEGGTFFNTLTNRTLPGGAASTGEFQVSLGGDAFAGVANASRTFKSTSAVNLIYNMAIGNYSVTSFLDALSQEQLTDVSASPSISTVDKKLATLFVGVNQAFLLTPPTAPGAIQAAAPQISSLAVGITLNVTPSVSANRMIRLNVFAEQSTIVNITVAGPTFSRKTMQTEMIVHDGETLALSGLTQEQVSKSRRGIPLLMNLPVLGRLFSENESIITKDDLLILITPRILDDNVPVKK